ncbi:hypothetical protein [Massilia sp.]|uniref:hypothetical protein n=1 Tax=Massilia sp. TaxID=1882437 RepID=UPI00352E3309
MSHTYSHSPGAAGDVLLKFCIDARRELRSRLTKPTEDDDDGWVAYTEALMRIRRMGHEELRSALATPQLPLDHWDEVGHFYAPITYYNGEILKYQGMATKGNQAHLRATHPAGITLDKYLGDRIRASDFSVVI